MNVLLVSSNGLSVVQASSTAAASFEAVANALKSNTAAKVSAFPSKLASTSVKSVTYTEDKITYFCKVAGKDLSIDFKACGGKGYQKTYSNPFATLEADGTSVGRVVLQLIAEDGTPTPMANLVI